MGTRRSIPEEVSTPLHKDCTVVKCRVLSLEDKAYLTGDTITPRVLAPPSPDYVPGPEGPEQEPPLPDIVSEPVYLEFMPPEDEVLPAEEQPLPAAASPTADSPSYVLESYPEEDPKEDDDEDPKEDPADYPTDGGDDGDDEDESFDDDEDDDVDIEGDREEEEHPALADSTIVAFPAVEHVPSTKETGPFETDESAAKPPPHPAYRVTARRSIRDEPRTPFWSEVEVARLLAIPSPPPSLLSSWLSPLPQIPSPPLPVSPLPLPSSPTYPLGYRVVMIQLRAEAPSTSHPLPLPSPIVLPRTRASMAMLRAAAPSTYILAPRSEALPSGTPPLLPIPLPTPSPPLLPPSTNSRADAHEACLPPRKRLCFAFGPRYEVGESSSTLTARPDGDFKRGYDDMLVGMPGALVTDETELGRRVTDLVTTVRQDTDEIYERLDDAQTKQHMVTSQVNMLVRDRRAHARTARLMKIEARITAVRDHRVAGSRPQETDIVDRGLNTDTKMAPKRATRSTPAVTTATTFVTNAQLQTMIDQGVNVALAARDAIRSTNGEDNHNSGMGVRRNE
ncbi:hypothetical protein Tco_0804063 [Tanacetum coccineum]|uniref:Uncharacterized protein n=1 Tax=Tanacetum coccineum TaxID=301880 RepID=A0ABQ5A3A7_9ASTR